MAALTVQAPEEIAELAEECLRALRDPQVGPARNEYDRLRPLYGVGKRLFFSAVSALRAADGKFDTRLSVFEDALLGVDRADDDDIIKWVMQGHGVPPWLREAVEGSSYGDALRRIDDLLREYHFSEFWGLLKGRFTRTDSAGTDLTPELGALLVFVGKMATAIRTKSAYNNAWFENVNLGSELLWLSDALHLFTELGRAIQADDVTKAKRECRHILRRYEEYQSPTEYMKGDPVAAFKSVAKIVSLQDGIDAVLAILERLPEARYCGY